MLFHRQIVQLISVIYVVNFAGAKKLCDIRVWYLNMITDDVFDVDLTDEQLNLKNSIESLVLKSSENRDTRMVDCSVLYMYNEMLKDLFNYIPSKSGMSLEEVETEDPSQPSDNAENDVKNTETTADTDSKEETQHTENRGEISETNEDTDDSDTNINSDEENLQDHNDIDHNSKHEKEDNTENESSDDEDTENQGTDETDHLSIQKHNHFAESIDETELLEDTDPDLSSSHGSLKDVVQPNQKNDEETQQDRENYSNLSANEAELFVTSSIPFGVCWSFGCLVSDIFDVYNREGLDDMSHQLKDLKDKTKPVLTSRNKHFSKRKAKIKCPKGKFCTLKCFYKFLFLKSFCMIDYVHSVSISAGNKYFSDEKKIMDADSGHFAFPRDIIKESNTETVEQTQTIHEPAKAEQHMNVEGREKHSYFAESSAENKLSRTDFENIVEQKTSQYYSKIQTIEVMIMKLENKLLMEALNKQNHSSTITKLENQILKLENELLRMNKNYQNLREESENVSRRQNRYLELAYKQSRKEYPKLPDHSKEKYELITQHQTKINELAEVLRNQSSVILELKGKYESLEEQNKMLHQMVMNQTIFMSSIVKTVQDLTDQNVQNQNEIKALKHKVETKSILNEIEKGDRHKTVENIIDDLDTLLFDNMLQKGRSANDGKEIGTGETGASDEKAENTYSKIEVKKKSTSNVITNWCPTDNRTCPSCNYSPIVYTSCIPFRNVVWSTCKGNNFEKQKVADNDYPTIPDVLDEGNEININGKDTHKINKQKLPEQVGEMKQGAVDNDLKFVQNDDGKTSEEISEDNTSEEIPEDTGDNLNIEKATNSAGNHAFGRYTILGYDKDGKPVFRIREDTADTDETAAEEDKNVDVKREDKTSEHHLHDSDKVELTIKKDININESEQDYIKEPKVYDLSLDNGQSEESKHLETNIQNLKAEDVTENKQYEKEKKTSLEARTIDSPLDNDAKDANKDISETGKESSVRLGDNISSKDAVTGNKKEESKTVLNEDKDSVTNGNVSDKTKDIQTEKDSIVNQDNNLNLKDSVHENKQEESKTVSKDNKDSVSNDQKTMKASNVKAETKQQAEKSKTTNTENKHKEKKIPINLNKNKQNEPKDCYDYFSKGERRDGLFKVKPLGTDSLVEVFCDMRRGGWTVIQRRQDGTTNFFQEWDDYKKGFGGLYGEHWLGNDNIHLLTNQDYYKLRVDLMDWDKTKKYAEFDYFLVDSEEEGYKLHIDGYSGDSGDGLTKHDGSKFSTKDVDNDKVVKEFGGSCAKRFYGAGWYYKCYSSNLNGKFYKGGKIPEKRFDGVTWKPWTGPNYSLKKVEMKIRPASAKK